MDLIVIEYSGCCYAHEPREFFIDGQRHVIARVFQARTEQVEGLEGLTMSVWDVEDAEGSRFKLTYHWVPDFWEAEPLSRRE